MKRPADTRDVAIGLAVVCGRAGVTAGKVALVPLKVAARTPVVGAVLGRTGARLADEGRTARSQGRDQLEATANEVIASPEVERAVDQALAGPLPEAMARTLVERHVLQRVAEQLIASAELEARPARPGQLVEVSPAGADLERLLGDALESRLVADITDRVLASDEFQRVLREVASSPAVRTALTRQTTSLAGELSAGLRSRMASLDDAVERAVHRRKAVVVQARREAYGGLGVRGVAFAVDLAATLGIFLAGAAVGWLVSTLLGGFKPQWLAGLVASIGWALIVGGYLVVFWTVTGQTPGMRFMRLHVVGPGGRPPSLVRSLVRLVGLGLAIVPLFAGFVPVLFDGRRRALQDYLAGTVVRAEDPAADQLDVV